MSNIHPTAVIDSSTKIGKSVVIEPYVVIKGTVAIGDDVTIKSHVYLEGNISIGEGSVIYPGASIGTKAQANMATIGSNSLGDVVSRVTIGRHCEIREFVTINSPYNEGSVVSVGDHCLIMAYCHIAHHCKVGKHVIMTNGVTLGGYVEVEDYAHIGGLTPIHQFVRVGCFAMVGGLSRVVNDIPPYTLGGGNPYRLGGLNLVGLKRHKFRLNLRKNLTKAFKLTYRSGYRLDEALRRVSEEVELSEEIQHWIDFCKHSKRGLIGLQPAVNIGLDRNEIPEYTDLLEI